MEWSSCMVGDFVSAETDSETGKACENSNWLRFKWQGEDGDECEMMGCIPSSR